MCGYGIIESSEIEDYIWDNYVLEHTVDLENEIKLGGTKASLANGIVRTGILTSFEDVLGKVGSYFISNTEMIKGWVKSWDKELTSAAIDKMTLPVLLMKLNYELAARNRSLVQFIDDITKIPDENDKPTKGPITTEPISLKDVMVPPGQELSETATFSKVEDVSQARINPAYSDVFKKLDIISKRGMSQQEINEKINPTKDLGGGLSMVGGKIIDENAPSKKIDRKKIKTRRVMG